jgi:hypothetical protein
MLDGGIVWILEYGMLSICKWHKVIKVHKLGLKKFNLKNKIGGKLQK